MAEAQEPQPAPSPTKIVPLTKDTRDNLVSSFKRRLDSMQPPLVAISLILFGLVLLLCSVPLGLLSVDTDKVESVSRQVGYLPAINWSIGIGFLSPAMIYFWLSAYKKVPGLLDSLVRGGMLLDSGGNIIGSSNDLLIRWDAILRRCLLGPGLSLAIIVLIACLVEWWGTSAHPLLASNPAIAWEKELDWSVGVLLNNPHASVLLRVSNAVFTFVCFLLQALAASCLLLFCLMNFTFAVFVQGMSIVPSLKSSDKRCGFEKFEPLLQDVLFAAVFASLLFYTSRLQNAYLHSGTKDSSLLSFILPDVAKGAELVAKLKDILKDPEKLKDLLANLSQSAFHDYSDAMVFIGGVVVALGTLFIIIIVLRGSAIEGKRRLEDLIDAAHDPLNLPAGFTADQAKAKLANMEVWPLQYVSLNRLLTLCLFTIASLWLYRVGIFVAAYSLISALQKVAAGKKKSE